LNRRATWHRITSAVCHVGAELLTAGANKFTSDIAGMPVGSDGVTITGAHQLLTLWLEMTMTGRAKAGVVQSDAAVFAAARKRLDDCPTVPGTVRVHVDGNVVTLTGTVQHASHRADAEHVVRPVIEARRLLNNIVVMAPAALEFESPSDGI
jgi:hypothetical protein